MKFKALLFGLLFLTVSFSGLATQHQAEAATGKQPKCVTAPCDISSPTPQPTAPVLTMSKGLPIKCVTFPCPESIQLNWTANPAEEQVTSYELYRDNTLRATISATSSLSFKDTIGGSSVTYNYYVRAIGLTGAADSNTVSYTTKFIPDNQAPSAPTNVRAEEVITGDRYGARISWMAATDNVGVTQYIITRYVSDSAEVKTFYVPADQTSYDDLYGHIGSGSDAVYTYAVTARDAAGNISGFTNQPTYPFHTSITVSPTNNYGRSGALVTWDRSHESPQAAQYVLWRLQDGVLSLVTYFSASLANTYVEDMFLEPGHAGVTVTYFLYVYDSNYAVLYGSEQVTITIPPQPLANTEKKRLIRQSYSTIRPKQSITYTY